MSISVVLLIGLVFFLWSGVLVWSLYFLRGAASNALSYPEASASIFFAGITLLFVLFGGTPDLMDGILSQLGIPYTCSKN